MAPKLRGLFVLSGTAGMQISRPYTVVLPSLQVDPSEREYDGKRFHLMIKLYPDGTLTPTLNSVEAGELSANLLSTWFSNCTTTRDCCYVDNNDGFHHRM